MKLTEQLLLLDRLHSLIRRKGTGTPAELAQRLDVSERTVYNHINALKDMGAAIGYCKNRQSYYYFELIEFNFDPVVPKEKLANLSGGQFISTTFFSTAKFLQSNDFTLYV